MERPGRVSGSVCILLVGVIVLSGCLGATTNPADTTGISTPSSTETTTGPVTTTTTPIITDTSTFAPTTLHNSNPTTASRTIEPTTTPTSTATSTTTASTTEVADTATRSNTEPVAGAILWKNVTETDAYDRQNDTLPIVNAHPDSNRLTVVSTGFIGDQRCTQPVISRANYDRAARNLTVGLDDELKPEIVEMRQNPNVTVGCNATVGTIVLNATFEFDGRVPQSVTVTHATIPSGVTNVTRSVDR